MIRFPQDGRQGLPAARWFPALCLLLLALFAGGLRAGPTLGLRTDIVADLPAEGAFPLVDGGFAAPLWHSADDHAGVVRAIGDLRADVNRVTGLTPALSAAALGSPPGSRAVIIGTAGRSTLIDALVDAGKLDLAGLAGKWESFVLTVVPRPFPGVDEAFVIVGSDKRGTIYGIYELSEQIGVSPWYWWADVAPRSRSALHILPGRFASGEPGSGLKS